MSNPTTPFGWQMPTNTDLVTDLPADFEVFGQAVATSMADLLGGTTGQVLSKASNTDMDFTWVTDAAGDITGVTAGTGISGGGTSGTVTVTNSMATAMTTSGDLIQATGSGTFARLATGTNGQYLTTNGTTNSWASVSAGGMTLISTTTLSGATTDLTSIPQTYNSLFLVVTGMTANTSDKYFLMQPNADTSGVIDMQWVKDAGAAQVTGGGSVLLSGTENTLRSNANNSWSIQIDNYTSTTRRKPISFRGGFITEAFSAASIMAGGLYASNTAITSIRFTYQGTNTFAGGTVLLYGVK